MNTHPQKSGFTLAELLLAITLSGMLVLACGVIMRMGLTDHQVVTHEISWEREINRIVESLVEDLASARNIHWHQGRGSESCLVGWLGLKPTASQQEGQTIGDLCALGYTLVDRESASGRVLPCLLRQQVDSGPVFEAIRADEADQLWRLGPDGELLAEGVLIFELWPLLRNGPESWRPWHPELRAVPEVVELHLVLASPALQDRLKIREDWDRARWNAGDFGAEEIREVRTLIHLGCDAR